MFFFPDYPIFIPTIPYDSQRQKFPRCSVPERRSSFIASGACRGGQITIEFIPPVTIKKNGDTYIIIYYISIDL